jgi:hypothetical protein
VSVDTGAVADGVARTVAVVVVAMVEATVLTGAVVVSGGAVVATDSVVGDVVVRMVVRMVVAVGRDEAADVVVAILGALVADRAGSFVELQPVATAATTVNARTWPRAGHQLSMAVRLGASHQLRLAVR